MAIFINFERHTWCSLSSKGDHFIRNAWFLIRRQEVLLVWLLNCVLYRCMKIKIKDSKHSLFYRRAQGNNWKRSAMGKTMLNVPRWILVNNKILKPDRLSEGAWTPKSIFWFNSVLWASIATNKWKKLILIELTDSMSSSVIPEKILKYLYFWSPDNCRYKHLLFQAITFLPI